MASLDVEALLDATAREKNGTPPRSEERGSGKDDQEKRRDRSRDRERSRDRDSGRRDRDRDGDRRRRDHSRGRRGSDVGTPRSDAGSHGARRSRSRGDDRRRRNRDGDYYRGGRRSRSRSRSPPRHYRPRDDRDRRDRRDNRDRDRRDRDRRSSREPRERREGGRPGSATPQPTEDERDRRTVFCQQLANRLRSSELKDFFAKVGPVVEAQIVKDRVSHRSKGVGYVEFKNEESVTQALQLTGQKLKGIPIIVQLTEAEKNRQARNTESGGNNANQVPFHRLYVGNIHFNVTEEDLRAVFESFGELEFVQLQRDENNRSRGYGFVQFRDATQAREALEKMNNFDLAGRNIRVGLGNDKFTPESTAKLMNGFQNGRDQNGNFQGSSFSGAGGRGSQANSFDRAGGRDSEKTGGASALDDSDVVGVNFNNYSRDSLMRKLARTDESATNGQDERQTLKPKTEVKPLPVNVNTASRCVVLHNMFDPAEEEGDSWVKELEDDVRQEAETKYGHVVHISVDPNSKGDIYLKFDKVQGGENAIKGLNGRFFGGRMIDAAPVVDAVYSSLFSRTRAV